ncbi:MAG: Glu-tRNA(Gln) amidotransferase subunit GatE [Candidatus Woesearchaeota archaeon]
MAYDYKKLGLKCGLEIHAQLEGKKLFCNCKTIILDNSPDLQIKRNLRAVIGESGEIDTAAVYEQNKKKEFIYNYYKKNCCLVELDEEPPHEINKEALKAGFIVSKFFDAKIIDEIQVMRKTVIDGSNTTGFQRTALVSINGKILETDVKIDSICIEEDAANIVKRSNEGDVYNLSRLGIPLIEIATSPDIKTPEDAKISAEKIGIVLRSTKMCKRGIGTIRQDVNVSIKGGERVEIKGVQDLRQIPKIIEFEVERQLYLIDLKNKFKNYKLTNKFVDITNLLTETKCSVIKKAFEKKGVVYAIKINDFNGLFNAKIQTNKRFGTEISDYAKSKAGVNGLFHSDELPKYGITENEVLNIKNELNCNINDAFILISDVKEKALKAILAVIMRINLISSGVLKEVRKANEDGSTTFLRPMPTGARMYPETDVMPIKMDFKDIKLPELIDKKAKRYENQFGFSKDLALEISKSDFNLLFENLIKLKNVKPAYIAEILVSFRSELLRNYKGTNPDLVTEDILIKIFNALDKNEISKESVLDIIVDVSKNNNLDFSKFKTISDVELKKGIKEIIDNNKNLPYGAIMGEVMKIYRGKADGKLINEIVRNNIKN